MSSGCGCVPAVFRREPSKRRQTKKEKMKLAQDSDQQTRHSGRDQVSQNMDNSPHSPSKPLNGEDANVTSSLHIRLKKQRTMSDPEEDGEMEDIPNHPVQPRTGTNSDTSPEALTLSVPEAPDDESSSLSTNTGSTTIAVGINSNILVDFPSETDDVSSEYRSTVWSPSCQRKSLKLDLSQFRSPDEETSSPTPGCGISPANTTSSTNSLRERWNDEPDDSNPTIWQPFGAPVETPQFRSVKLGTPPAKTPPPIIEQAPLSPEKQSKENPQSPKTTKAITPKPEKSSVNVESNTHEGNGKTTTTVTTTWTRTGRTSNLPASQSPTITLLQKAREGQIPKGAVYIDEKADLKATSPIPKDAILIDQKVTVEGDKIHTDSYYAVPTSIATGEVNSQTIKATKYDGIGPTECGIPVGLRTGVKDEYASDWYKTMYRSLHKAPGESRGHTQTVHLGGYMSEPEFDRTDYRKADYASLDYRSRKSEKAPKTTRVISPPNINRVASPPNVKRVVSPTYAKTPSQIDKLAEDYLTGISNKPSEQYKNQPRSIAEYEPGHSSLAEREFQKFWDDFWDSLDDLHEHFKLSPTPQTQRFNEKKWPNAILCDGYESDSTLIRKSGRPPPRIDPCQQKAWYKEIQKGGEIPLTGLRKTVPEKPKGKESQHQYQETEVNIHFKSPIRNLEKEYIEEEELRKRQEDAMRKFYIEERQKKQLREAAELEMRRHCDFFTPSQKSPIPLNRYDNPFESSYTMKSISPGSDHPRTLAQVIYPFVAQSTRELSLSKGDIVYINKQIDRNWYEGEHHGFVGIFPVSYVMVIPTERANLQPKKATEGHGVVKYTFRAKTPVELSLFKGERVVLMRRVDRNWYDGRIGTKRGIFPVNYIEVFQEPGETNTRVECAISPKPPASPVYSPIINGSSPKTTSGPTYVSGAVSLNDNKLTEKNCVTQSLHVDTYNEPIPYRSLYAYHPQNEDELELKEGDTVYVMEKCDDGWYVGTSLRSGLFGTFPGNYVERI